MVMSLNLVLFAPSPPYDRQSKRAIVLASDVNPHIIMTRLSTA